MLSKDFNIKEVINCKLKYLSDPSLIKKHKKNKVPDILFAECIPLEKISYQNALDYPLEQIKIILGELKKIEKENPLFYSHFNINYLNYRITPTLALNGLAIKFKVQPIISFNRWYWFGNKENFIDFKYAIIVWYPVWFSFIVYPIIIIYSNSSLRPENIPTKNTWSSRPNDTISSKFNNCFNLNLESLDLETIKRTQALENCIKQRITEHHESTYLAISKNSIFLIDSINLNLRKSGNLINTGTFESYGKVIPHKIPLRFKISGEINKDFLNQYSITTGKFVFLNTKKVE